MLTRVSPALFLLLHVAHQWLKRRFGFVRASFKENGHNGLVAFRNRDAKRRVAVILRRVLGRAGFKERGHDGRVATWLQIFQNFKIQT